MAAKRSTPTDKVAALLKKTVANGCTRPGMIVAQDMARTLCKKHGLDASGFVWPEVPAETPHPEAKPAKRKRGPKAAEKAIEATFSPREGTKGYRVFEAIKRDGGATVAELLELTGWAPHSLRGWVSIANKAGATISSTRAGGVTRYHPS